LASITATQAIAQLQAAIEFGNIAIQQAPGGHPLFTAIAQAQEALDWVEENIAILPLIADGSHIHVQIDEAIEAINAAAATLRNDSGQPLPATIWPQVQTLPWPWIAAGVGGLMLIAIVFQRQGAR
jgi:hypothetical protein